MPKLPTRIHIAWHARCAALTLDQALAAGREPDSDAALTRRAAILTSRRARRRTAAGLRRVLTESTRRPRVSAAVACDRDAVSIARPALEQLERAVRGRGPARPQGLALASLLLTDPESPLYRGARAERLYESSRAALLALRPEGEAVRESERRGARSAIRVG